MSKFLQSYLKFWATRYLKRVKPKIIVITGSVGKTSTKEAIFEVLQIRFQNRVRKSWGNLNTKNGISLAILGFHQSPSKFYHWIPILPLAPFKIFANSKTKILVLEIAADQPGDIKYIASFVRPNITVLTSIGQAHLEIFGTMEKIIEEKTEALRALPSDGYAVLNIDDENVKKLSFGGRWQVKTCSLTQVSDVTAKNITTEIENYLPLTKFQVITATGKFLAETKTLGRVSNIYPALTACAVGEIFNLKKEEIITGIKNITSQKHRMEVFRGHNNSTIIDDTYNANPLSMKAALATLKILPAKRKIAVLGDMLEIGKISPEVHRLIGEYANEIADEVVTVGNLAKGYRGKHFDNNQQAIEYLLNQARVGDILLIKASRALALEDIVEALRANPNSPRLWNQSKTFH